MTKDDNRSSTDPAASAASAPVFQLQRVYLKDASLEMPNAPQIFLEQGTPQIEVQLDVSHDSVVEGVTEVVVRVTVTARLSEKVLFLVEAKQAGIFELRGIPEPQLAAVLGIVCPGIIYPYLRANVADLLTRTGLPPIHLAEINFEALYQQRAGQGPASGSGLIIPTSSQTRQ
ncbi:MAG TPA: protein-export chaperone SecB [Burkholderiaceae bacterium]|nr:protein-export chaperone SecB [Burkholderiaceae bacterium]